MEGKSIMTLPKSICYPLLLMVLFLVEFLYLAIEPHNRVVWLSENSISLIVVATMVILYCCKIRFSNLAYTLIAIYVYCHTVGGHFTFERVPIDSVTEFFGFERNHYDRMCHFMVGFFAYPAMEFFEERHLIKGRKLTMFLMVMAIFGVSALFELVEWIYAVLAAPEEGNAFLGSQGDIWDAQKDMLCDGCGAIFSVLLYGIVHRRDREKISGKDME